MPQKSERWVETQLRERVESAGGWCIKLLTYIIRGLPDRLILMPGNRFYLVECKKIGKNGEPTEPTRYQRYVHKKLSRLGIPVYIVYDKQTLDSFMEIITKE